MFCFHLLVGWATLLRVAELVVHKNEAGRGRLLRGVVGVETEPPAGLLSRGIPLPFRDWRLVEAEPLIVGLT